jgi:PAS domain S-box-containing protein
VQADPKKPAGPDATATDEDALRQSEERYRLIVESALDYAIFTTDHEGNITHWPPGAAAVFGWRSADASECQEPHRSRSRLHDEIVSRSGKILFAPGCG